MNWVLFLVTRWLIWGASWSIFLSRFHCHTLGLCPAPHDQTEGQLFPCILQKFEKGNWFLDWNESYAHHDLIGLLWLVSLVRWLQCPTHEKMLLPRPEAPLSHQGAPFQGFPTHPPSELPSQGANCICDLLMTTLEDAQASQSWAERQSWARKRGSHVPLHLRSQKQAQPIWLDHIGSFAENPVGQAPHQVT